MTNYVILLLCTKSPNMVGYTHVIREEKNMTLEGLLITLIVGAVAGWLAGTLMKGSGFGLVANIVIGIIGAFVGGYVLGMLGVSLGGGLIAAIINATIGAIILLLVIGVLKKAVK